MKVTKVAKHIISEGGLLQCNKKKDQKKRALWLDFIDLVQKKRSKERKKKTEGEA